MLTDNAKEAGDVQPSQGHWPDFLDAKQAAAYLHINTKKVYALVGEGKIPATKVTGKWLFPRKLIDQWLMESSHGGLLTDRLVITGSDDPLLQRAVIQLVRELQGRALVTYTCSDTELGLSLLARHRADVCGVRWGPAQESARRHAALVQQYAPHKTWVLVRGFQRRQGIIVAPGLLDTAGDLGPIFAPEVRWAMRQDGASSQRQLRELLAQRNVDPARLRVTARALNERDAASLVARDQVDVAPGTEAVAAEFGLEFVAIGWEAYDFALDRGIYFRALFQQLIEVILHPEIQRIAESLGGYNFSNSGQVVWSA
ncbi:MAG: helix-turn-helix transcriptional regulator [Gammaproteobacteria bacterium]|nr:helix-turn-helix transcriptional regulator [Gammaproteobacteria bacterium]